MSPVDTRRARESLEGVAAVVEAGCRTVNAGSALVIRASQQVAPGDTTSG